MRRSFQVVVCISGDGTFPNMDSSRHGLRLLKVRKAEDALVHIGAGTFAVAIFSSGPKCDSAVTIAKGLGKHGICMIAVSDNIRHRAELSEAGCQHMVEVDDLDDLLCRMRRKADAAGKHVAIALPVVPVLVSELACA